MVISTLGWDGGFLKEVFSGFPQSLKKVRDITSISEVSDKILSKVIPWLSYFIMRVLIKFRENLTYRMCRQINTGLSKKMDGIWDRYNLKSTGRIYTFGVLKCWEKFKVLDLP